MRKLGLERIGSGADIRVDRVDTSGSRANENLADAGLGLRYVLELQDFGSSKFVKSDGFHAQKCITSVPA